MRFNSFRNRLIISALLAAPSYTLFFLIRGYDFSGMTFYAHVEYSVAVFVILILLFETHTIKSRWLDKRLTWKSSLYKRIWMEGFLTLVITPSIVTPIMLTLYLSIWDMSVWFPGMLEYNLFALSFSLSILAFVNADIVLDEWKTSLLENEILEKESAKARLGALQAQISPHFLFNNFNVLNALIDEDQKLAQKYLDVLSNVYRYVLNHKNEELVYLKSEVDFIEKYLFLLQIRFNDHIKCSINIEKLDTAKVPPATLQILVENAVKHNEISSRKPLEITIRALSDEMIEVKNNLQPKKSSVNGTEVGLNNISDRLKYFTDVPVKIIHSASDFIVQLPVLKNV